MKRAVLTALFFILCFWGISYYLPALNGPFVLDDTPNFYGLRFIRNIESALAYSFSGPAGMRWISYLSFTAPIEMEAWGNNDAYIFKLINLVIHSLNSLLIFVCLHKLLSLKSSPLLNPVLWAAGITTIWFIHPIHAGTVLYSVQRMTLLSSTAVLAGVYYHLAFIGKSHLQPVTQSRWFFYTCIIWLITGVGILCKESAILLPLYILTCYSFIPARCFNRLQTSLSLLTPYMILIMYLIFSHRLNYGGRDFTMAERLLSEVFILKDYATKIILPSFSSFSLYYDDFIPVKTITDPRFVAAALFWLALITLSKLGNRYMPGLWFGCLWFLAGHALESTIIPLELYFDHRNYLPCLGILIMLAAVLSYLLAYMKEKSIIALLSIAIIALTGNYLLRLKQETSYWHNNTALSSSNFEKHPDSMRANQYYIEALVSQGRYREAILMIEDTYQKFGVHASNAIFQAGLSCLSQPHITINHNALINDLKTIQSDMATSSAMEFLLQLTKDKACPSLTWEVYEDYTNSLLSNPRQVNHYHNLVFLLVGSYMQQGDLPSALKASFKLPQNLHSRTFVFLQMHLALSTKNIAISESVYKEINEFDKANKILYKDDIEKIGWALERLRNENKN